MPKNRPKPAKNAYKKRLKALQTKAFLFLLLLAQTCENEAMEVRQMAYVPYQQQPVQIGYQPQQTMQAGIQPMYGQQYQAQQPVQEAQMFCRPVASADEARAVPVDFSGRPMILPHLSAGKIYVKIFDAGCGSSLIREFRMAEPDPQAPQEAFAPMREVEQIKQTLSALQEELRQMKSGGKRKQQQEAVTNEV